MMAVAWLVTITLRRLASRAGLLRYVWHPALFVFSVYMIGAILDKAAQASPFAVNGRDTLDIIRQKPLLQRSEIAFREGCRQNFDDDHTLLRAVLSVMTTPPSVTD